MSLLDLLPGNSTESDFGIPGWNGLGGGNGLLGQSQSRPQYIIKTESDRLEFQAMLEMSTTEDSNLPSEPIEQSSFATYNRVIEPIDIKCRLGLQGTSAELQSTLDKLSELRKGMDKLTFVTPSASYQDLMLQGFDYRKDDHTGHNVLLVDLTLVEIREVATAKTTTSVTEPEPEVSAEEAADGSCASADDIGEVQTSYPTGSESSSADSGSGGGRSSILHDVLGGRI
jgi:hypothetical protein